MDLLQAFLGYFIQFIAFIAIAVAGFGLGKGLKARKVDGRKYLEEDN